MYFNENDDGTEVHLRAGRIILIMYVLPVRSGVIDAGVEAALFLVSLLLCAITLDRVRGLCLEHKLREGSVVSLDRHSLTVFEALVTVLVLVGLPIAALVTSLGRNGETSPVYTTKTGVVDIWDAALDLSQPQLLYNTGTASVLECGTSSAGLTPQVATVGRKNGKGGKSFCPGQFKNNSVGFVEPRPSSEEPPTSLYPASDDLKKQRDWRSQCINDEKGECFTWKWKVDSYTVCKAHNKESKPSRCQTYRLAVGAPKIDSDNAVQKVAYGLRNGAGISILAAHFTVTTLKTMNVEVLSGQMQVTVVDTWSWVGLTAVLLGSVLVSIWILVISIIAKRRWGYTMRLHTYAGIASYAASLEDTASSSDSEKKSSKFHSHDASQEFYATDINNGPKKRPHMRLTEGSGNFAGFVAIGHQPEAIGVKVKEGNIGTPQTSADRLRTAEEMCSSSHSLDQVLYE